MNGNAMSRAVSAHLVADVMTAILMRGKDLRSTDSNAHTYEAYGTGRHIGTRPDRHCKPTEMKPRSLKTPG